jgi:hypothetical protein
VGREHRLLSVVVEPLRPIGIELRREVDPIVAARLTPAERELERERREQARKRRRKAPEPPKADDGHIDLRA